MMADKEQTVLTRRFLAGYQHHLECICKAPQQGSSTAGCGRCLATSFKASQGKLESLEHPIHIPATLCRALGFSVNRTNTTMPSQVKAELASKRGDYDAAARAKH